MRLWAFLVLLGVSQSLARSNRTKRQFEADHCDPAYCQIPVGCYDAMTSDQSIINFSHYCDFVNTSFGDTAQTTRDT